MKTGRRLFMTLFIIVGGILVSGPMLFLIYGALGAALSGLLVLFAGALLPLPIMLAMKKMGWLPETVFRRPDRAPASSGNSSPLEQAGIRSARSGLHPSDHC